MNTLPLCTLLAADEPSNQWTAIAGIVIGAILVIFITITAAVRHTRDRRLIEESRREIAAYVAEGSMSAETAERLLAAGPRPKHTEA